MLFLDEFGEIDEIGELGPDEQAMLLRALEDIEPNVEFELTEYTAATGRQIRFNKEARDAFLKFATSPNTI